MVSCEGHIEGTQHIITQHQHELSAFHDGLGPGFVCLANRCIHALYWDWDCLSGDEIVCLPVKMDKITSLCVWMYHEEEDGRGLEHREARHVHHSHVARTTGGSIKQTHSQTAQHRQVSHPLVSHPSLYSLHTSILSIHPTAYLLLIYSRAVVEHLLHHLMREGDLVLDVLGLDAALLQASGVHAALQLILHLLGL